MLVKRSRFVDKLRDAPSFRRPHRLTSFIEYLNYEVHYSKLEAQI